MQRRIIYYIALLFIASSAQGQNLVPNPSFEDTIPCPSSANYIQDLIQYWFTPTSGSPDYFSEVYCGGSSVPFNVIRGFQYARTGKAYVGLGAYDPPLTNTREYIACPLLQQLQQNKKYCVTFYIVLSEKCRYAIDGIEAYFSTDTATCSPGYCLINAIPQVANPAGNLLTDSVNWTSVSGSYTAIGGEQFITVGNFTADANLNIISNSWGNYTPYYLIDDVSVIEMIYDTANAGGDKTICEGESVQLGVTICNGCIYQWTPAPGLSDTTVAQPFASPTQTTVYFLTVTDTTTGTICSATTTDTVTITVTPFLYEIANAGAAKTICKGESVTLGTAPCGSCTYQWQPFNDLNNSTIAQPVASPSQNTTYILVMTDSIPPCSVTTTDSVNIFVGDCEVEVYDIFTPNGDAKNEFFYIKNLPANSSLQIFNRWGSKVYNSSNYNNQWDGGGVPDGTYFYLLTLPSKEVEKGFVEIRR